jgi:hypothetical protein
MGHRARWSLDNSVILCAGHHGCQVHMKGDTEPIRAYLVNKIGEKAYDDLNKLVHTSWKPSLDELSALKEDFQAILDESIVKDCGL